MSWELARRGLRLALAAVTSLLAAAWHLDAEMAQALVDKGVLLFDGVLAVATGAVEIVRLVQTARQKRTA
ncbi:MAG TPA: hypothetical protein VLM89_17415 [Phycisphaerae bacterium]|nr:hypothetical protein [Phycisphaerae bacterium]